MSGWRTQLRPASFRGARFFVDTVNFETGRRWADHEYPARNTPFAEDLGRSQRVWRFTGYTIGDDFLAARDRLVAACEEDGPGELVHPTLGTVQAACRVITATEERERGRFCSLAFEFAEAGSVREPSQDADPDLAVANAAGGLGNAAMPNFAGLFSVAGSGPWVADAAIADVRNLSDGLRFLRLPGGLPQTPLVTALDYLNLNAPSLVGDPRALTDAFDRTFAAFTDAGEAGPVVGAMLTVATEWRAAAPRGSGGFQPGQAMLPDGISSRPRHLLSNPYATPRILSLPGQRARNAAAMEAFVAELALREIGYSITGMAFDNYDQAIETRRAVGQVFIAIEQQTADAGQDDVFSALAELRHAINAMIMARAASLNPLVTYRTLITANSITLAWRMYQDTDRDLELCDRVNARNPAFLPSTGRILAAGA
jgi:hypothetical protein